MSTNEKQIIEEVKIQWSRLWQERVDDQVRAEGVATTDYNTLFVEKGTIIHATRDYKPLNFKDILKQHQIANPDKFIPPTSEVGGWGKFIKTNISSQKPQKNKRAQLYRQEEKKEKQLLKKNGRGWLHK